MLKKYIFLIFSVAAIAAFLGCHAGGNSPLAPNNGETVVSPETRTVGANGRFTDITFPSGAVIKCPIDSTFQEGVKVTAAEQKIPVITDNSGKFSYIYVYNISAVLPSENSLTADVPVNTIEKPLSVTIPNNSTTGTCYIGTRASDKDPWRYSLATDGINSNAKFMRLSSNPPKTCTYNLFRLNIEFRLFVFDNESKKDEVQVDTLTLAPAEDVEIKDGKYTGKLTIKLNLEGENLNGLKAEDLIAKITYRSENQQGANINFTTNKVDSDDKAVTGSYEHSFEVSNIKVENTIGNTAELTFELNLDGVSLEDFPKDFLVEFYSKGSDENTRPFVYTQDFSFETKEQQNNPQPEPLVTYSITYDLDGGEPTGGNPTSYTVEDEITLSNPTKDGYTFLGWTGTDLDEATTEVTIDKGSTGNRSYTANWTKVAFTITYDLKGGTLAEENPDGYNIASETFTLNEPAKTGYEFIGWTGSNGDTPQKPISVVQGSKSDMNYVANWSINSYNLTLKHYRGSGVNTVSGDGLHEYNSEVIASCTLAAGFEFDSWFDSEGNEMPDKFKMPANDLTLSAWGKLIVYKITYNLDNGDLAQGDTNPTSYDITSATISLCNPTKEGYTFKGWSGTDLTGDSNTAVTIPQGSTGDKNFKANYTLTNYSINYQNTDGATFATANPSTYNIETENFTLNNPTKDDYTFAGWTGSNGNTPQTSVTIYQGSIGDKAYTANFVENYNITYDWANGSLPQGTTNPATYSVISDDITLNNPTRDGIYFMGWTCNEYFGASMSVKIPQGSTGNKTYTANWGEILTFNLPNDVTLVMHKIPAGTFTMGSPEGEVGQDDNETQHSVTISKDYWMGTYEVTQAQYKAIMGSNPSYFKSSNGFSDEDQRPVESVSWDDIMTNSTGFIARINTQLASQLPNGYKFDLPTEAQWEYACRAGTVTSLNNGTNIENPNSEDTNLNAVAWNSYNSAVEDIIQTHKVGGKTPNAWGLYDMHGNVYEWCKDKYASYPTGAVTDPFCNSGVGRVMRGGCFGFGPKICRSATRIICTNPSEGGSIQGFRLVLVKE